MSPDVTTNGEKRRDFEGFETRIEVSGAPTLRDMLPPRRAFNPEAVIVLHFRSGHWSGTTPYTKVCVVGGCVDDNRRPARIEWGTDCDWLWDYEDPMPEWLREFVLKHTEVDLSEWRPVIVTRRANLAPES